MGVFGIIILVLFVLVSLLLVFVIAIQSEDSTGLGGVFGGSSDSVFGGRTNRVINKITALLIDLFFVLAILVAFVSRDTSVSSSSLVDKAATTQVTAEN